RTASCTGRTWHSSSGRMQQRQKRNGQNSTRPTGPSFLRIRRWRTEEKRYKDLGFRRRCFGSFTTTTLCIGSVELCRREMRRPHAVVVRNVEITRGRIIWDCTAKQEKTGTSQPTSARLCPNHFQCGRLPETRRLRTNSPEGFTDARLQFPDCARMTGNPETVLLKMHIDRV